MPPRRREASIIAARRLGSREHGRGNLMDDTRQPALGPDFRSDNVGAASPEVIEAIARANRDTATGYGGDTWSTELQQRFSDLFEARARVFC
ncbi:MAG: hypothetical protein FJX69_19930, partial [Alphaproteobacteria bacterium]|nr:hypothetical protein [Alphaproteobacteria bacterium]